MDAGRCGGLVPAVGVTGADALERNGSMARGHDPTDRRRIRLSLTEDGVTLMLTIQLFHEDDLLFQCLGEMGEEKSGELLTLLREVVKRMPDGEEMLNSVSSRLYSLKGSEAVTHPPGCVIHQQDETKNEQEPITRRTTRRRDRRSRPA